MSNTVHPGVDAATRANFELPAFEYQPAAAAPEVPIEQAGTESGLDEIDPSTPEQKFTQTRAAILLAQQEHYRRLYTDSLHFKAFTERPEVRDVIELSTPADMAGYQALAGQALNRSYLGWVIGREVPPELHASFRDAYAQRFFGLSPVKDDQFYKLEAERLNRIAELQNTFGSLTAGGVLPEGPSPLEVGWNSFKASAAKGTIDTIGGAARALSKHSTLEDDTIRHIAEARARQKEIEARLADPNHKYAGLGMSLLSEVIGVDNPTREEEEARVERVKSQIAESERLLANIRAENRVYKPGPVTQAINRASATIEHKAGEVANLMSEASKLAYPVYGVDPEDKSAAAQIGRGGGNVFAMAPAMIGTGGTGLALVALQGASQSYAQGYDATAEQLKASGVTDPEAIDNAAREAASAAAVRTLPALALYMVGGRLASNFVARFLPAASPLSKGLAGAAAATTANIATSSGIRALEGQDWRPTIESLTQDTLLGGWHGVSTGGNAAGRKPDENPFRKSDGTLRVARWPENADDPAISPFQRRMKALVDNVEEADRVYNAIPDSKGGKVIGTDIARELPEEFRDREGKIAYSLETSYLAGTYAKDRLWRELENPKGRRRLYLTAGGVAAGKSSVVTDTIIADADLVYDGTLRDTTWTLATIDQAIRNGWEVRIEYVQRPIDLALEGAIKRADKIGRWGPLAIVPETHRSAQQSILKIAKHYEGNPKVRIRLWLNDGKTPEVIPQNITLDQIDAGGKYHYGTENERWMDRGRSSADGRGGNQGFAESSRRSIQGRFREAVDRPSFETRVLKLLAKGDPELEDILREGRPDQ